MSGGYYGSSFENENSKIDVAGGGITPVSLSPDNESHQLYVSGGYNFTSSTRGSFKFSYGEATQNEAFFQPIGAVNAPNAFAATGRGSADAKVNTTLMQLGVFSRPVPKLSLRADVRYEDRDDQTPRLKYINSAGSRDGFNVPLSRTTTVGRVEAQYLLPMGFRVIGGLDYDKRDREVAPTLRQASWREKNDETTVRLELKRSLSETVNGSVAYLHAKRDGSDYLSANNAGALDVIDPIHWADRDRDQWRFKVDWAPAEPVSLQFRYDYSADRYDDRPLGPESGINQFFSADATIAVNDDWQLLGWLSRGDNRVAQRTISGATTWVALVDYKSDSLGIGVRGKPKSKVEVGADLQWGQDKDGYTLLAAPSLPDVGYRHTTLNLFGKYAIQKNAGVKVDYIYDRWSTNDWAWQPVTFFTNGTQVYNETPQKTHFIGVSGYYEWR